MVIAMDLPLLDTNKSNLAKSASALEHALNQLLGKNVTLGTTDIKDDALSPAAIGSGNGFDDWLAADLQFDSFSSDESSMSPTSAFSSMGDSPLALSLDSFDVNTSSIDPSLFELPMPFATSASLSPLSLLGAANGLTTAAVQEAAAALNIPWSQDLEKAVLAQAALAATPIEPIVSLPAVAPKVEIKDTTLPSVASAETAPAPRKSKKRVLSPEEKQVEVVQKRARNTDAARRSRLKKLIKVEGLEAKVSDLESTQSDLNMRIAVLETEKVGFMAREAEQTDRIAQLEAQLAEAHANLGLP